MTTANRFRLLSLAASILTAVLVINGCSRQETPQNAASNATLTIISFGGAYQAAQSKAYMKPFGEQTGIRITEGDYNGDYGVLKQRAEAPDGPWDVVSVESAPTARGTREGIFLPISESVWAGLNLLPEAKQSLAAGHLVFSTILAYDVESVKTAPTSWADFWNTTKFPGKRGLRNNPRGTLEIALLASGVDPKALYPLDVDRAFRQLDKIRSNVVFWEAGAQPVQLLANKTVSMTSIYNGRAWNAKTADKLPIDWSWNHGLMETEYWAVPKNTRHAKEAMQFIAFALRKEQQSAFANEIAYGPTNLDAVALVKPEILRALPNSIEALPLQVAVNSAWWAKNEARVGAMWERWQSGR